MPNVVRHVLTILAVEDLASAVAFYQRAFDWPIEVETPVYVELALPEGQRLGLYQREGFGKNIGRTPLAIPAGQLAPCELYLHTEQLESAIERIKQAGAQQLSALSPRPWGDEAAYFSDPSGVVLALARPVRN